MSKSEHFAPGYWKLYYIFPIPVILRLMFRVSVPASGEGAPVEVVYINFHLSGNMDEQQWVSEMCVMKPNVYVMVWGIAF